MPNSLSDFLWCLCCCIPLSSTTVYEQEYNETKMSIFMKAKTRFSKTFDMRSSPEGGTSWRPKIRMSKSPKSLLAHMKRQSNYITLETIPSLSATPTPKSVTFQGNASLAANSRKSNLCNATFVDAETETN